MAEDDQEVFGIDKVPGIHCGRGSILWKVSLGGVAFRVQGLIGKGIKWLERGQVGSRGLGTVRYFE